MTEHGAEQPAPPARPRLLDRPVADIAGAIIDDYGWHDRDLPPGAEPFLQIMLGLSTRDLNARYRNHHVADVVRGALSHLHDWHGETAWRVKHELEQALRAAEGPHGGAAP